MGCGLVGDAYPYETVQICGGGTHTVNERDLVRKVARVRRLTGLTHTHTRAHTRTPTHTHTHTPMHTRARARVCAHLTPPCQIYHRTVRAVCDCTVATNRTYEHLDDGAAERPYVGCRVLPLPAQHLPASRACACTRTTAHTRTPGRVCAHPHAHAHAHAHACTHTHAHTGARTRARQRRTFCKARRGVGAKPGLSGARTSGAMYTAVPVSSVRESGRA
jgi:hypothetical protein